MGQWGVLSNWTRKDRGPGRLPRGGIAQEDVPVPLIKAVAGVLGKDIFHNAPTGFSLVLRGVHAIAGELVVGRLGLPTVVGSIIVHALAVGEGGEGKNITPQSLKMPWERPRLEGEGAVIPGRAVEHLFGVSVAAEEGDLSGAAGLLHLPVGLPEGLLGLRGRVLAGEAIGIGHIAPSPVEGALGPEGPVDVEERIVQSEQGGRGQVQIGDQAGRVGGQDGRGVQIDGQNRGIGGLALENLNRIGACEGAEVQFLQHLFRRLLCLEGAARRV